MLDLATALQAAVKGVLTPGAPMVEVNAALGSLFACFVTSESAGDGLFDGILIEPWLKDGAVAPPSDPCRTPTYRPCRRASGSAGP
jgi:hypothetical protein